MNTPGYNVRLSVRFGVDKRGRNIAWAKNNRHIHARWVPVSYDEARMWVAGNYVDVRI